MLRGSTAFILGLVLTAGCGDDGGGEGDTSGSTSTSGTSDTAPTTNDPTTGSSSGSASAEGSSSDSGVSTSTTSGGSDSSSSGADGSSSSGSTTGTAACEGMSFFATSVGSGKAGGNLGGLDGADATCQALADAVGQGDCTWRAYLSTSTVDARDRIGTGPWENSAGDVIAASVEALHTDGLSNGDPQHVLDENGAEVPGNEHDILTGSNEDGTLLEDATCLDWTSNSGDDRGQVGHSDIPGNPNFSPSWNAAHLSNGCTQQNLQGTGGSGRLYCFAL